MLIIAAVIVSHIVYHLEVSVLYYEVCCYRIDEKAHKCDAKSKNCYVSNILKELSAAHIET